MSKRQTIQDKAEETLKSLDGVKQAVANPYLFTRIKARLQKERKGFWFEALFFINKPAVAVSAIAIVIFINAAVFFAFRPEPVPDVADENEQVFASEYNLSSPAIYDATIDQQ